MVYILLTMANMGTVLLLFESGITDNIFGQLVLMTITISLSSYFIAKMVAKKMMPHTKAVSFISLCAVVIVVLLSMIWNMSIEPNWYKLFYLGILLITYPIGYTVALRNNRSDQNTMNGS